MKYYFFIFILLATILTEAQVPTSKSYLIKYDYLNYSVSPNIGLKRYEFLYKNAKVVQILDLKNAKFIPYNKAFAIKEALKIIKNSNITSFPFRKRLDPYSFIEINSIKRVSSSYSLNLLTERNKELKEYYKKWLRKKINKYKIRVQDSRYPQYQEGIELTIENKQVIEARDVRSYQEIPIEETFVTVTKLFGIAKWGLQNAIIDYDREFFFPNLIIIKNPSFTFQVNTFEPL